MSGDVRLLVAGDDRVDAGKTTFAAGLVRRLADRSPAVFKPRAGNDYWFDHDDVCAATTDGRLYGKDVARLLDAAGSDAAAERRNPVHRLWRPTPGRTGMLGDPDRTFLLDRVSTPDGPVWVRNAGADLPELVRERLPVADAHAVDSVAAFNDRMREFHLPALERVADDVRAAGNAVVESYGDVADPLDGVDYDAVATVTPGRARVYDGERWAVAGETAAGGPDAGRLEERVGAVTAMLDPLSTHALPALSGAERDDPDAVAETNAAAYDALIRAAEE